MKVEEKEKVHSPLIDKEEKVKQLNALAKRSGENSNNSKYRGNDIRKNIFIYMTAELQFLMLNVFKLF